MTSASVVLPGSPMTIDGFVSMENSYSLTYKQLISWQTFWNLGCSQVRAWEVDPQASWPVSKSAGALVWSRPRGGQGGLNVQDPCFQSPQGLVWGMAAVSWVQNQVSLPMCIHAHGSEVDRGVLGRGRQRGWGRLVPDVPWTVTQRVQGWPLCRLPSRTEATKSTGRKQAGSRLLGELPRAMARARPRSPPSKSLSSGRGACYLQTSFFFRLRNIAI